MANLLRNAGFEQDHPEGQKLFNVVVLRPGRKAEAEERDNLRTPVSWLTYFYHDPDRPEDEAWHQPEVKEMLASQYPRRVFSGDKSICMFGFYRRIRGGFVQRVWAGGKGARVRLRAHCHGWSNLGGDQGGIHPDDGNWSEGIGRGAGFEPEGKEGLHEALTNLVFRIGIDPTGSVNEDNVVDARSDRIVWGPGYHVLNQYAALPPLEVAVTSNSGYVTVFLECSARWPFKHNDCYWDAATLEIVEAAPSPAPAPLPDPTPDPASSDWEYPVVGKGSKLGIHSLGADAVMTHVGSMAAASASFPVVKAVEAGTGVDWIANVKRVSPETVTVIRIPGEHEDCQGVENPATDLRAMAKRLVDPLAAKANGSAMLRDSVDYWEVCNEPDPPGTEGYRRLGLLMIECMEQAEAHGLKLALLSLNVGTPEWDEMAALCDSGVFAKARAGGHILALHEGVVSPDHLIDRWWNDDPPIPGAPTIAGAGALCFRYRCLYHLLRQRGEVVPLIVSEWCGYDQTVLSTTETVARVAWYDEKASDDYYVLGFLPFTLAGVGQWANHDYGRHYAALVDYAIQMKDTPNALPPADSVPPHPPPPDDPCFGLPREQYRRVYVLLPQDAGPEWAEAAVRGTADRKETIGYSADDAGIGALDDKVVVAVNPDRWPGDLAAFYQTHYPGTEFVPLDASTPAELLVLLRPELEGDFALSMTDPRWKDDPLGELAEGATIGQQGCLLLDFCMALRRTYGRDLTPPELNWALAQMQTAFTDDAVLSGWGDAVGLFSAFDQAMKVDRAFGAAELEDLLGAGWEVILKDGLAAHFVYLESVRPEGLQIVDPASGTRRVWPVTRVAGVRGARKAEGTPLPPPDPSPPPTLQVGLNDPEGGLGSGSAGAWLLQNRPDGVLYVPVALHHSTLGSAARTGSSRLDFSVAEAAGIRVIVNLRWSWSTDCGGHGTLPPPGNWRHFADACLATIADARGVWGWTIGNEPNNPREYPAGGILTSAHCAEVYDAIYEQAEARLAPPPIDPFFGPGAENDCGKFFAEMWGAVTGADFVDLHGYVRGPDPDLCWSEARFSDDPLRWQGLNYWLCCQTLLEQLPTAYRHLSVVVSEFNHIWKVAEGQGNGWAQDERAGQVVRAAIKRAREWNASGRGYPIAALVAYRWQGDDWKVNDNRYVLDALRGA